MVDPSKRVYVIRRTTLAGRSTVLEKCASFGSHVEAESFIHREIAPFSERGSAADRWWCKQNGVLEIDYWLDERAKT